jgi:hypothetical protein
MAGVTTPVVSPNPYANADDLAAFWRTLTEAEASRANDLLTRASNRLRLTGERVGVDVDDKVNNSPAYFSTVQWVVMEAAKRAMLTPIDAPPANSIQQTAGPYSENIVFTNPAGDLWFKKSELHDLGLYGNQTLKGLSTSQRDIYSPYESS